MAEIDIDKIIQKTEKMEEEKRKKEKMIIILASLGIIIILILFSFFLINIILGEKSLNYFPVKSGIKYFYNKKNMPPEEWEFLNRKENVNNYECYILNILNKGNFFTTQEYYYLDKKEGIIRLAISENYGKIKNAPFKLLPSRIKKGKEFKAGKFKNKIILAKVEDKEEISLPIGIFSSYKVRYFSDNYDEIVWFVKDVGIVKRIDNKNNIELTLIDRK